MNFAILEDPLRAVDIERYRGNNGLHGSIAFSGERMPTLNANN
jgi:hypothetical protein